MFIEIDKSYKSVPQIALTRNRNSSILKKADIRLYTDAKKLVNSMKAQIADLQEALESEAEKLISQKESQLKIHMEELCSRYEETLKISQTAWLAKAEKVLSELIAIQQEKFATFFSNLKDEASSAMHESLARLSQSKDLINYLTNVLHDEINDFDKKTKIEQTQNKDGVTLTMENDDEVVSINTHEFISKLKSNLEIV